MLKDIFLYNLGQGIDDSEVVPYYLASKQNLSVEIIAFRKINTMKEL
jgi:hypothetical protein